MNPDALTDQLELFLDVLETGSFSAAARRHPLTPSAVARRIDALARLEMRHLPGIEHSLRDLAMFYH